MTIAETTGFIYQTVQEVEEEACIILRILGWCIPGNGDGCRPLQASDLNQGHFATLLLDPAFLCIARCIQKIRSDKKRAQLEKDGRSKLLTLYTTLGAFSAPRTTL